MNNKLTVFFLLAFYFASLAGAAETAQKFITILPATNTAKQKNNPLKLHLKEIENGAVAEIAFGGDTASKEKIDTNMPPGGMYTLIVDGIMAAPEPYPGMTLKTEKAVALMATDKTEHTLRCELLSPTGKTYTAEIQFEYDGHPIITIEQGEGKTGIANPVVGLQYFSQGEELAGVLEAAVDEHRLDTVQITSKENGKKRPLSNWLDEPIDIGALAPGRHFIKLTARGNKGGERVQFFPFQVETIPQVTINKDKAGQFDKVSFIFQTTKEAYTGNVEIYYNQGVILAQQTKEADLTLNKADILEAFNTHKLPIPQHTVTLVLCARSANNSVHWQPIEFHP